MLKVTLHITIGSRGVYLVSIRFMISYYGLTEEQQTLNGKIFCWS